MTYPSQVNIAILLISVVLYVAEAQTPFRLSAEATDPRRWATPCSAQYSSDKAKLKGCTPLVGGKCDRIVHDSFASADEVKTLIAIAQRGMAMGNGGVLGPTIMDVNSGWVFPAGAQQPIGIYRKGPLYSSAEYDVYRSVSTRLKDHVVKEFGLDTLYFTAPTFITREAADLDGSWKPSTPHDEYWHPHVDKNNTAHYDYSGLLYLTTSGEDFEGGELHFFDSAHSALDCSAMEDRTQPGPCLVTGKPTLVVEPRAGRAIVFGSGRENPHRVTQVTGGTRYVLSFWFTCDARREMISFLDGKMHVRFGETKDEPAGDRAGMGSSNIETSEL